MLIKMISFKFQQDDNIDKTKLFDDLPEIFKDFHVSELIFFFEKMWNHNTKYDIFSLYAHSLKRYTHLKIKTIPFTKNEIDIIFKTHLITIALISNSNSKKDTKKVISKNDEITETIFNNLRYSIINDVIMMINKK
jgi:hypothetical protein